MLSLFLLLLGVNPTSAQLPSCRVGMYSSVPGTVSVCDPVADCNWCERDHFSLDFLCCERGTWLSPHFVTPLLVQLAWQKPYFTFIWVVSVELYEVVLFSLDTTGTSLSGIRDVETVAASLLGDVLLQGALGLIAGYAMGVLFSKEAIIPPRGSKKRWGSYILVLLIAATSLIIVYKPAERIGLIIYFCVHLSLVIGLSLYSDRIKFPTFLVWVLLIILSTVTHFPSDVHQPLFSVNEWYQNWLLVVPAVTLLLGAAFIRVLISNNEKEFWYLIACTVYIVAVVVPFYILAVAASDTLVTLGTVVFLVFASLFFLLAFQC